MFPDYGGTVRSVVMQYAAGSQFVLPVYRDYLKWQGTTGTDFTVYMACPEPADFNEIKTSLAAAAGHCNLIPVYTHHTMTPWSRDRWVALLGEKDRHASRSSLPKAEQRARRSGPNVPAIRISAMTSPASSPISSAPAAATFTLMAATSSPTAASSSRPALPAFTRNIQHTAATRDELARDISRDLGLNPIFMDDGPDHHAGMSGDGRGPASRNASVTPELWH